MSDKANISQETTFVKPKKRWPIVLALVLCIMLLFFAVISVVVALADFGHGEIPTIFGWGICSSNGEYEPIDKNAAIFMRKIGDADTVSEGDVVLFYYEGARSNHKVYAGQVLETNVDTLHVYINEDLADVEIGKSVLRGEVHYYVGHVGYILNIIEDRYGVILSIALVVLLLSVMILLIGSYMSIKEQRKVAEALNEAKDHVNALSFDEEERATIYEEDEMQAGGLEEAAPEPIAEKLDETPLDDTVIDKSDAEEKEENIATADAQPVLTEIKSDAAIIEENAEAVLEAENVQSEETQVEEPQAQEEVAQLTKEPKLPVEQVESVAAEEELEPETAAAPPVAVNMPYATNMMFLFTVQEATLLKRLIEIAAEKREGSQIVAEVDEQTPALRVNCGAEDVAYVNAVITAFKKRRSEKG